MIDAAGKAFADLFTQRLRRVLLKSIGLALLLILLIGVGLHHLLAALAENGATWAEQTTGFAPHAAWSTLAFILSVMAGLGIVTGALFLMPAVTAFVGSFFVDEVADVVEREHYPAEQPGRALPFFRALIEGIKIAIARAYRLSLRAAVHFLCRARRCRSVFGQCLSAQPGIFRTRRHALPPAGRSQGDAQEAFDLCFSLRA